MSPRLFPLAVCLATLLLPGPASAQQKLEIFKGGEKSDASAKNVLPGTTTSSRKDQTSSAQSTAPVGDEEKSNDAPYSEEATLRIRTNASQLAERSFDSFSRGLMPLHDHLDQLQLAARSEFRLIPPNGTGETAVAVRHLSRVRKVERALRQLNEPNAAGYRADLLLAQAMVAQAEFDLASIQGQQAVAEFAAQRARILAERHLLERRFDSSLGLASLSTLVNAEMLTPAGTARGRELLMQAVRTTRRWSQLGSGLGRPDKVAEAEFELARFDFFVAFDSEELNVEPGFQTASRAAQRMLDRKIEYYRTGTASLYEIARTWQNMRELVEYAASTESGVTRETVDRSRANLNRIIQLAQAKSDKRGRIAADLAYVSLINEIATAK